MKRDQGHAHESNLHSSVFPCRTGSALALLYGTSATLEHHHFNHAVMILQSEVSPCMCCVVLFWPTFFNIFRCTYSICITTTQLNMSGYHAKAGITLICMIKPNETQKKQLIIHYYISDREYQATKSHWNTG